MIAALSSHSGALVLMGGAVVALLCVLAYGAIRRDDN